MGARECRAKREDHLGSEVCVTHIPFRARSTLSAGDEVASKVLALIRHLTQRRNSDGCGDSGSGLHLS